MLDELSVFSVMDILPDYASHMRLATGFDDDAERMAALEPYLRSGIAAVEGMIGRALLTRDFVWQCSQWHRDGAHVVLPIAPVRTLLSLTLVDADGQETEIDPSRYVLLPDIQKPILKASGGGYLPKIPDGGVAKIELTAGYGSNWSDIPVALRQAVLMMAAHFEEQRHGGASKEVTPYAVRMLLQGFRQVRL